MRIFLLLINIYILLLSDTKKIEFSVLAAENVVDTKSAQVVINILNKQIVKNDRFEFKFKLYGNPKETMKLYKNKELKILSVLPEEYFTNLQTYDKYTNDIFFSSVNNSAFHEYYVIANKEDKNIFKNLEKYTLNYDAMSPMAFTWFKTLFYEKKKKSFKKFENNTHAINRTSSLVHSVFFKKKNISVISKINFDTTVEVNPQIMKKIKILKKSKKIFIYAIVIIRKDILEDNKEVINDLTNDVNFILETISFGGSSFFSGLEKAKKSDLDETKNLFIKYEKLYKKYENDK